MAPAAEQAPPVDDAGEVPVSRRPGLLLGLALLATLPFLTAWGGSFLDYDDPYLISANQVLPNATLLRLFDPTADRQAFGAEYLPVRDLTYWVDVRLFGERDESGRWRVPPSAATGFRAMNLAYYALACALVWAFLRRLPQPLRPSPRGALLGAWLFAWHPAHAESVAWVAGRKDLVSACFVLGALLLHLRARAERRPGLYAGSAGLAGLACLAKSTATALPLLILALEAADPRGGRWRDRLTRVVPSLLVCGGAAVVAVVIGHLTGIAQPGRPLTLVAALDLVVLRRYLVTTMVPLRLQVDHGDLVQAMAPTGPGLAGLPWGPAALAALTLAPLAVLAWRRRGNPWITFVGLWFLGGLLPVLNLVPFVHWIADRFLFLPLLAPCLAAGYALDRMGGRRALVTASCVLALLGLRSAARAHDFRTSLTLWEAQHRVDPGNALALSHLGQAHLATAEGDAGRIEAAGAWLERALSRYAALPAPNPGHELEARLHLGDARRAQGRWLDAWRCYQTAVEALHRPALSRYAPAVRRRLEVLAGQAAAGDSAEGLEVAVRALLAAARPALAREALDRLTTQDPTRARALREELRLAP